MLLKSKLPFLYSSKLDLSLKGCDLAQIWVGWWMSGGGWNLTKTLPVFTVHQSSKEEMQNWLEINFHGRVDGLVGGIGLMENIANSAQLELGLGLSLAI